VVDSSKREEMGEVSRMLENIRSKNTPYVIVANKQDLPGAMSDYEIKEVIGAGDATIVKTVATEGRGVMEAFLALAEKILEGGDSNAG